MRHSTISYYDLTSIKPFQYTKLKQVEGTLLTRPTNREYMQLPFITQQEHRRNLRDSCVCKPPMHSFLLAQLFEGRLAL